MSKLAKFRSKHGEPKRNPPLGTDVVGYIVPGFAAFAATRMVTRIAAAQIAKRSPKYAKHAGAIASAGSFAAAWFGAHRVKQLEVYHHPIVIGSGLAALQSLIQIYLPKLGWLLGDPTPAPAPKALPVASTQAKLTAETQETELAPSGFRETSPAEWYAYNDAFDAGSYKGKPQAAPEMAPTPDEPDTQISELLDNSDLQLDNSDMGLFS